MSQQKRHRRTYRDPTRAEWRLIRGAEALDNIFDNDKMAELLDRARRRIVTIFYRATEWRRGRYRRTDNYIVGVDERQKCLARYILKELLTDFVFTDELPAGAEELAPLHVDSIISNLHYRLVLAQIDQMVRDADIWYDGAFGIWQTSQRCHDEMLADKKRAKRASKFDKRQWHGRPRRQARRRGTREGDSIGYSSRAR